MRCLLLLLCSTFAFGAPTQPIAFLPFTNQSSNPLFDVDAMRQTTARVFRVKGYFTLAPKAVDRAMKENAIGLFGANSFYRLAEVLKAGSFFKVNLKEGLLYENTLHLKATYIWLDLQGHLLSQATVSVAEKTGDQGLEALALTAYRKMAVTAEQEMSRSMSLAGILTRVINTQSFQTSLSLEDGLGKGSHVRVESAGKYIGTGLIVEVDKIHSQALVLDLAPGRKFVPNQKVRVVELKSPPIPQPRSSRWVKKSGRVLLSVGIAGIIAWIISRNN